MTKHSQNNPFFTAYWFLYGGQPRDVIQTGSFSFTARHNQIHFFILIILAYNMFTAAIFLMLIHLHGANSQGEGTCTTVEMRREFMDERLSDLGCDNYTCCM